MVGRPISSDAVSRQDWAWTAVWGIGALTAGAFSLWEQLLNNSFHVFGPIIGLVMSGIVLLTWWATKSRGRALIGLVGLLGVVANVAAGILEIASVTSR